MENSFSFFQQKKKKRYLPRNPSSFTPTLLNGPHGGKHLLLGSDEKLNWNSIAQFDKRDADAYPKYEEFLHKARQVTKLPRLLFRWLILKIV